MNVYIIETPHQLLNAVEAKNFLGFANNFLIIIVLDEYPFDFYLKILDKSEWNDVHFISFKVIKGRFADFFKYNSNDMLHDFFNKFELYLFIKRMDI